MARFVHTARLAVGHGAAVACLKARARFAEARIDQIQNVVI